MTNKKPLNIFLFFALFVLCSNVLATLVNFLYLRAIDAGSSQYHYLFQYSPLDVLSSGFLLSLGIKKLYGKTIWNLAVLLTTLALKAALFVYAFFVVASWTDDPVFILVTGKPLLMIRLLVSVVLLVLAFVYLQRRTVAKTNADDSGQE